MRENRDVNSSRHNLRRSNRGFTLVELIVVIVIIAILAGLTVAGILAWRDWADFNRENEYAETLFVAAQNQLNDYSADGRLITMQKALSPSFPAESEEDGDDDSDPVRKLREKDGYKAVFGVGKNWTYDGLGEGGSDFVNAGYTEDEINTIWAGSNSEKKYQDRIVSLRANKGDYSRYLNGEFSKKQEQYWVYELLSSYIYDTSIINDAAICIEFTPADGQVFSVFYSDKNTGYTYKNSYIDNEGEETPDDSSIYSIIHDSDPTKDNRAEDKRRDRKVGYYDVDTLYKSTSTASRKQPVIDKVQMHNEETLYLTYEITKEPQAVNQMTYKVYLLDEDKDNKPELVIEIDGTKIKGRDIGRDGDLLPNAIENYIVDCKVTRYDMSSESGSTFIDRASGSSSSAVSSGVVMDSVPVIVWSEGTDSAGNYLTTGSTTVPLIHVVLDMADLNATQENYKAYSDGIRDFYLNKRFGASADITMSQDNGIEDNSFAGTQSFFRFGLAPDEVLAKVEGSSTSRYKSPEPVNNIDMLHNNKVNTAFAAGTLSKDGATGSNKATYSITKARHLYNMRYIEALDYETQDIVLITTGNSAVLGYATSATNIDFTLDKDDDNNGDLAWDKSIEKQLADKADQPLRAIANNEEYPALGRLRVNDTFFGGGNTISGLKIEYTEEEGEEYKIFHPTGFINRNYGTVRDLTLDRTTVSGGDFTGGFFGVNACEAINLTLTDTCEVKGRKYVGGIAGIVLPSGNHTDHNDNEDLKNACTVYNMKTDEKKELEKAEVMYNLTNQASVTGSQAVGGIAGAVRNDYTFIGNLFGSNEEGEAPTEEEIKKYIKEEFKGSYTGTDSSFITDGDDTVAFLISGCTNYGPINCVANDASGIGSDETAFSGGIAGYVYDQYMGDDDLHIVIDNCNGAPMYDEAVLNGTSGIFSSAEVFRTKAAGNYVGGIAGYNYGGQISNCYSQAKDNGSSYVIGKNYVGGITGLNLGYLGGDVEAKSIRNGRITSASGEKPVGINRNIVAGDSYVGGVVGSNSDYKYSYTENSGSGSSGSVIRTKAIESYDPEDIVLERSKDNTVSIVPDREINLHNRVSGFINMSQVYNAGKYGGGIAGYNTGYLFNNNSTYNTAGTGVLFADNPEDYTGSYIGAIAGYNNGIMGNTVRTVAGDGKTAAITDPNATAEAISAGCYIRGNNFLGGVVGYNDSDSIIEDYNVSSGKIYGNADGCFVGGYAGFNSAPGLLMDLSADNTEDDEGNISYNGSHTIYSNIDLIEGGYFVGGDIGGNILNKKRDNGQGSGNAVWNINNIGVAFRSDGFFRRLTGKEFVGGYIGYNLIINNNRDDLKAVDSNYENKNSSMIVADYLAGTIGKAGRDLKANNDIVDKLATVIPGIGFYNTDDASSYMRLYIKGQKGSAVSAMSRITGELHVGGVIGYNDDNSLLCVEDVENATPIYATEYIENPDERKVNKLVGDLRVIDENGNTDYTGETPKEAFVYSYGGGIIGRVGARTTLKNCRNAQQGLINTKGTYLGGLCEVNDGGKLTGCYVSNLGYSTHDYVGGLCGLNKGVIELCTIDGMTISGRNVVGGLTAENLGILRNNSINNTHIRALGLDVAGKDGETEKHGVAGTYTGVNGISGEIILSLNRRPDSTYDIENIDVVSTGRYVGGIAGVNKGFISNSKEEFKRLYTDGYTGYADKDMSTWITFTGTIRGESYVGGLVGKNDIDTQGKEEAVALKYMLKGFDNYATVIADNGTAGGIVGQTTGKSNISFCANHGSVSSPLKGNSGGIIAENGGVISYCRDFAPVSAVNGMSGGIAAVNKPEGELLNIRVEAPSGVDQSIIFESKTACGAVAAQNQGKISGVYIYRVVVTNVRGYERANIGAIVGQNIFPTGTDGNSYSYSDENDRNKYGYIYLDGESQWDYSSGTNIDSFKNIIKASVIVRSNNTNAGGIAGTNSGTIKGESVGKKGLVASSISLDGCDRANIGGVAGTNSRTIENISVDADIRGGKGNDSIGYGGITGLNTGTVRYCTFDGVLNTFGNASNPASAGGIAGINRNGAIIEYCGLGVINRGDGYSKTGTNGNMTWIASGDFYGRDYHSPDLTAYSYLGGIAGTNYGTVRDIDLAGKMQSSKNAEINSSEYVGVIGFNGTVGGLVGINRPGGKVTGYKASDGIHYLTTHGSLEAAMHGSETGSGAGGVIGIDYTGGPFEYIENNTYVQARYDVDVRAGGIIANCQPSNSSRVVMENIVNYGQVTGYRASGGLIGELMYAGFNITNCQNYGEIRSEEGDSGGMIGTGEMLNTDCYFTGCTNHGHVYVPQFAWDDSRSIINESTSSDTGGGEGEAWDGTKTQKEYLLGDVKILFELTGYWPGGYNAKVTMFNYGSEVIDDWAIAMDYQGTIKDLQGQAQLADKTGTIYKIKCLSWNADIAPNGGSQSFAISGEGDFAVFPASFEMLGSLEQREITEFTAEFVQDGETWDEGRMINANIYITNTSSSTIEDWTFSFNFDREIVGLSGASIIEHSGSRYTLKNNDNENNFIEPGQTITLWLQGSGGSNTDIYNKQLMSYNPTASQTSTAHNYNGAGGMLGSYLETNGAEHVYLYNCVNTGIVERVWEKGAKPDIDNIAQNIGAFVGRGYAKQSVYRCYWHFDLCRNYNPIADTTEGFIGTSGRMAGEYFTNCLDNSALVTSSEDYSPFLTHRGDEVTMSNCYYLNDDQVDFSTESYNTRFTFIRGRQESGDGIELYYKGKNYKTWKSPGIFLTPPSSESDMSIQSTTGSFQLAVTSRSDSPAMDAFNVYLWNDKNNDLRVKYNYSVYAVFVNKSGKTATSATEKVSATSNVAKSKVSLKVPSVADGSGTFDRHVDRVTVFVKLDSITSETVDVSEEIANHSKIYMRGFTWTPEGVSKESTCTYLADLYGLEFNIDSIDTDYSNKYLTLKNCPQYSSSSYYEDIFGARFYGNEVCYFRRATTSYTPSIKISVNNTKNEFGIGAVNAFLTADPEKSNREYRYTLKSRFFDKNGNAIKNWPAKSTETISTGWISPGQQKKVIFDLTEQLDTNTDLAIRCESVVITFTNVEYRDNGGKAYKADTFYFAGFTFNPHKFENKAFVLQDYLMAPESSSGIASAATTSAKSIKLAVDSSEAPANYKVYQNSIPSHYFDMVDNDPLSENYYRDSSSYTVSQEKGRDYRISTYEEMDPKFLEFIRADYSVDPESGERLKKPLPLTCTENGRELRFHWEEVEGAYAYEVKYRIVDMDGNNVAPLDADYYTRQLGVQETEYIVNNESAWEGMGYSVDFKVKAVSGSGSDYDSEYNEMIYTISKKVLAEPKVHLELTDDNNMAAVLDNRDDYAIKDSDGNVTGYIDCDVKVTYNGRGIREDRVEEYTIHVKDSRFSSQSMWVELDDEKDSTKAQILAWAEPSLANMTDYQASGEVVSSGHLADNEELWNGDSSNNDEEYVKYKGMTYIPYGYKKRLRGFRGEDVDHMEYLIQYKHFDDKDAWMRSDISEYDEDLGMWVAVVTNEAHIGASGGHADYITTLSNLPKEWFSEDNPTQLLVRNYLARSENDIVLYGHDVATGIKLNGGSPEANKEILKQITDPYHLTIDWDTTTEEMERQEVYNVKVEENASVWDNSTNSLKEGYVLVKNNTDSGDSDENSGDEPTYSIYYNSTLYLAKKKNVDKYKNGAKDRYGNDYEYYKFDVVYKYYDTAVNDITVEYEDSTEPESVKANDMRAMGDHKQITFENGHVAGTNYNESYQFSRTNDKYSDRVYQDTSPVPILSGGIRQSKNTDGKTTYTIRWDEFYRNEKVWNRDRKNPLDPEYEAEKETYEYYHPDHRDPAEIDSKGVKEDYYVANTWTAFANKTGYYETSDTGSRKAMMNAYYLTYSHNVSYTVDIIGITAEGNEVVLDTQTFTEENKIPVEDAYTAITYVPKDSSGNKYTDENGNYVQAPMYKKWAYQATFTREDDWIYDNYKVRITNNGSKYCMLEGLTDKHGDKMGVNDNKSGHIGELYYDEPFDDIDKGNDESGICFYRLPKYRDFDLVPRVPFDAVYDTTADYKTEGDDGREKSLSYTVNWSWTGYDSSEQTNDLGGFLITARKNDSEETGSAVKDHYYYVEEIPNEEAVNASIDLDMASLSANGIVAKIDTVSGNYIADGNKRSIDVDLSDFYDGDRVDLSVTAIPRTGAKNYCDGEDGIPFELIIDSARHAPDPDKLEVDSSSDRIPEYENAGYIAPADAVASSRTLPDGEDDRYRAVLYDTWKNGLWISYKTVAGALNPSDYSNDGNVNISAAIAVYESAPDDSELPPDSEMTEDQIKEREAERKKAVPDSSISWNAGAYATLYTKDVPLNLGKVSDQDIVQVILGDESDEFGTRFSGMWIKITLKVTAETGIDSRWSDQDAAGVSVNYRWIHLPYILKAEDGTYAEGTEPATYDNYKVTSGAGDLLTEGSGSDNRGTVSGNRDRIILEDDGMQLEDNSMILQPSGNGKTKGAEATPTPTPTPVPTPTLVPEPTAAPTPTPTPLPEDADVPSSGTETGSESDKDDDKDSDAESGSDSDSETDSSEGAADNTDASSEESSSESTATDSESESGTAGSEASDSAESTEGNTQTGSN